MRDGFNGLSHRALPLFGLLLTALFTAACATATASLVSGPSAEVAVVADRGEGPCPACNGSALDSQMTRAIEKRIEDLKARGGLCSAYGAVLETSYRSGQIIVRPFMWRVGSQLTSGEAKPNGEMILAREIDPLNVGVRTLDDLLWTMEHEAVHIAFRVENDLTTDRADTYVRACREKT
ncbi:MAG TPA: hypothetical protein VJ717_15680 [Gemmatimonadaceae bacterium]|nr:hypothetical protein [Gemmatimonadaceae bacterium]